MVDVVVNDVMATSLTPDLSKYMFKDKVHPYLALCHVLYSPICSHNTTRIARLTTVTTLASSSAGSATPMFLSLILTPRIPLSSLDSAPGSKNSCPHTSSMVFELMPPSTLIYCTMPSNLMVCIRHVNIEFWPVFCGAAGVYCIGEVDDDNIPYVPKMSSGGH